MTRVSTGGRYNLRPSRVPQTARREQLKHESVRRFLEILDGINEEPGSRGVCPDCGGSGQYIGLRVVENCSRCGGTGEMG